MILKACALVIIGAVCAALLREFGWRGVPVFCAVCIICTLSLVLPYLAEGISLVKFLGEYGVSDICESAVKIVGIGYLTSISSDACSELGFPGLSGPVSFAGRMEMLAISFPYFRELVSMGAELVK